MLINYFSLQQVWCILWLIVKRQLQYYHPRKLLLTQNFEMVQEHADEFANTLTTIVERQLHNESTLLQLEVIDFHFCNLRYVLHIISRTLGCCRSKALEKGKVLIKYKVASYYKEKNTLKWTNVCNSSRAMYCDTVNCSVMYSTTNPNLKLFVFEVPFCYCSIKKYKIPIPVLLSVIVPYASQTDKG